MTDERRAEAKQTAQKILAGDPNVFWPLLQKDSTFLCAVILNMVPAETVEKLLPVGKSQKIKADSP